MNIQTSSTGRLTLNSVKFQNEGNSGASASLEGDSISSVDEYRFSPRTRALDAFIYGAFPASNASSDSEVPVTRSLNALGTLSLTEGLLTSLVSTPNGLMPTISVGLAAIGLGSLFAGGISSIVEHRLAGGP